MSTKNLKIASGPTSATVTSYTVNISPVYVGMILPFAGPTTALPTGWLLCDGSSYSTTNNPILYSLLGAATTPNLIGSYLYGVSYTSTAGVSVAGSVSHTIAYPAGATFNSSTAPHSHTTSVSASDNVGHYHNHDTNSYAMWNTYASNGANKAGNAQGNLVSRDHNHFNGAYWATAIGAYLTHSHNGNTGTTDTTDTANTSSTSHNHTLNSSTTATASSGTLIPPTLYVNFIIKAG